ncbi:ADP-ribose glycohydrolase MACROD1 (Fragment), partial [Geodia barretti]
PAICCRGRLRTEAKPRVCSFRPFSWRRGVAATVVMDNQEREQGGDPNGTSEHSSGGGGGPTAETPDKPDEELKSSEKAVKVDEEATTDDTPAVNQPDPSPSPKRSRGTFRRFFSNFLSYDRTSSDAESEIIDFSQLPIEKKRNYYKCEKDYLTLSDIPPWSEGCKSLPRPKMKKRSEPLAFSVDDDLNGKVSLWRGDITRLEIDAIVNAANSSLLGGGGVDGAIHSAAGRGLLRECRTLGGCDAGDAKLSQGYRLPAKYVLHTVGPTNNKKAVLENCYRRCLELALVHNIRSLAFPCIATGVYGFPNEKAAQIALVTTRKWLEENRDKVDRIIFCVFLEVDYKLYCRYLHHVYPIEPSVIQDSQERVPAAAREDNRPLKPTWFYASFF